MISRGNGLRGIVLVAIFAIVLGAPAGAQAVTISTVPTLYPSFDPSVTDYVTRCNAGTPVSVTVSTDAGETANVDRHGEQSGAFTTAVGLSPGQSFQVAVTSPSGNQTYFVRCLPSDFPASTVQRPGTPQAEWYFLAPFSRTDFTAPPPTVSRNYVAIYDTNGVPVWWMKSDQIPLDFHLLPDGNVIWTHFTAPGAEEHRLDGSLVRSVDAVGAVIDPHEALQLPNGNYLLTVQRGLSGQSVCGSSNLTVADDGIQEVTPSGSVVWSWWASDHIPLSEVPSAWCNVVLTTTGSNPNDAYHINAIEPAGDGYLVSFRHLDAVYGINKSDGSISWKLGGVNRPESLTVLNDPLAGDELRGQHDPRIHDDGTITIHDNGFHPSSSRPPRVVRYAIDTGARTATLVQQLNDPGTVSTPVCCGSARELPGGDMVMSWGSAGLVTELTPAGARVFSLTFDDSLFSYRAHPEAPGVLARGDLRNGMDRQFPRGFARPKGSQVLRASLVPAFTACTSPNRTHGAPLSFPSCRSPSASSSSLTVGTPDANGAQANGVGHVTYTVMTGDPSTPADESDVSVKVDISDVRQTSDLADYAGQLQLRGSVRITDRQNGSAGDEAATVQDNEFPVTVPCTPTASASIGSDCAVSTTFDAVVPGAVAEGKRSNWELGPVEVYDGGASGVAGSSDARLFERQGVFVP